MGIIADGLALVSSVPMVTIEVDPGIDDVIALMVMIGAHKLGLLKILAIVCSNGNVGLRQSCENTKKALDAANIKDYEIPLFYGVESAIVTDIPRDYYFLEDGLGMINPPVIAKPRTVKSAICFGVFLQFYTSLYPKKITYMSLGSLTFLSTIFLQQPNIQIKDLWIMGGNNLNVEKPEWNVMVDPEAAHFILRQSNKTDITIVNYQDCKTVQPTVGWRKNTLGAIKTPFIDLLNEAENFRIHKANNSDIWYQWDPILAVAFANPQSVTNFEYESVQVNLSAEKGSRGLFIKGNYTVRALKSLHLDKYQSFLERTALACQ